MHSGSVRAWGHQNFQCGIELERVVRSCIKYSENTKRGNPILQCLPSRGSGDTNWVRVAAVFESVDVEEVHVDALKEPYAH
jgi:hypothetical protein